MYGKDRHSDHDRCVVSFSGDRKPNLRLSSIGIRYVSSMRRHRRQARTTPPEERTKKHPPDCVLFHRWVSTVPAMVHYPSTLEPTPLDPIRPVGPPPVLHQMSRELVLLGSIDIRSQSELKFTFNSSQN